MHVIDRRDTFDLDQQYVFDDEVGAIGAVDGLVLVENGNRYLAFDRHSTENELAKLRHLKSGLMTDLLTGRVRVPETIGPTT